MPYEDTQQEQKMAIKKNCMFQCATKQEIIVDTDLITRPEAEKLWKENYEKIKTKWNNYESPQMCLWIDCKDNTDYHTIDKEIDYRDYQLINDNFYKLTPIN